MSSNSDKNHIKKRNVKKIARIKLRLNDKNKIKFSAESTLTIIVANAGLGNAVKRCELEMSLSNFSDHILDIITPTTLTFAIILAKDKKSSETILDEMEEFTILTPHFPKRPSVQAYCMFAEEVPEDVLTTDSVFNTTIPTGLQIIDQLINAEEENELIVYFLSLREDGGSQMKKRTVLHFGYKFDYSNNRVDPKSPLSDKPIPPNCKLILQTLQDQTCRPYVSFDQLTVNIYNPGDGIPPHVDTHSVFSDEIVSVSLGSDIIMEWTNPSNDSTTNVDLKARSACIMTGESRYLWHHGIAARKTDLVMNHDTQKLTRRQRGLRVSLTFRKVNAEPTCRCQWPQNCDIERKDDSGTQPADPSKLEAEFVHKVYDEIADHFSSTRHSMWPNVRAFIAKQKLGSVGADIGCGNGKYFNAIMDRGLLLACDTSYNLCKIASEDHKVDTLQSNCLQLPYRNGCCDFFISIAVLHHLSTEERRRDSVGKMAKMLCKGGTGLIYVWAKEQKKTGVKSHYIDVKNTESKPVLMNAVNPETSLPVHVNRTEFSSSDMLVPWSKKKDDKSSTVYTRYYHLFVEGELEALCSSVPGVRVTQSWYDSGNWAAVVERM